MPQEPQATAFYAHTDTPDGPFTVVVSDDGAVIASGWTTDAQALLQRVHPSLKPQRLEASDTHTQEALQAVRDYYDGDVTAPDRIKVHQVSAEFRTHVWEVLRGVPAGQAVTYSDLAALSGRPRAFRAAASACSNNAVALFIPCHRVLQKGGGIGGFLYGLDIKHNLLDLEEQATAEGENQVV